MKEGNSLLQLQEILEIYRLRKESVIIVYTVYSILTVQVPCSPNTDPMTVIRSAGAVT
jgi:hypothetical protein